MRSCYLLTLLCVAQTFTGCGPAPGIEPGSKSIEPVKRSIDASSLIPTLEHQFSELSKESDRLRKYRSSLVEATQELNVEQSRLDRLIQQDSSITEAIETARKLAAESYTTLTEFQTAKHDLDLDAVERVRNWKEDYRESKHREIRETRDLRNGIKNRLGISYSPELYEREDERERSKADVEAETLSKQRLVDERKSIAARESMLANAYRSATSRRDSLEASALRLTEEIRVCREQVASLNQSIREHRGSIAVAESEVERLTRLTEELESIVRDQQKLEK